MSGERRGCLSEFRAHRAAARKEMKESLRSLLPEAFWKHARESRREAKLACAAFRRAIKCQFRETHQKPVNKTIEIT